MEPSFMDVDEMIIEACIEVSTADEVAAANNGAVATFGISTYNFQ